METAVAKPREWAWTRETYMASAMASKNRLTLVSRRARRDTKKIKGPSVAMDWPAADPRRPYRSLLPQHQVLVEFQFKHGADFARLWDEMCAL